jgi:hypothetical protein
MASPFGWGFEDRANRVDRLVEAAGNVAVGALEPRGAGEALVELDGEAGAVVGQRLDLDRAAPLHAIRIDATLDRVLEARKGGSEALQGGIEGRGTHQGIQTMERAASRSDMRN